MRLAYGIALVKRLEGAMCPATSVGSPRDLPLPIGSPIWISQMAEAPCMR